MLPLSSTMMKRMWKKRTRMPSKKTSRMRNLSLNLNVDAAEVASEVEAGQRVEVTVEDAVDGDHASVHVHTTPSSKRPTLADHSTCYPTHTVAYFLCHLTPSSQTTIILQSRKGIQLNIVSSVSRYFFLFSTTSYPQLPS